MGKQFPWFFDNSDMAGGTNEFVAVQVSPHRNPSNEKLMHVGARPCTKTATQCMSIHIGFWGRGGRERVPC